MAEENQVDAAKVGLRYSMPEIILGHPLSDVRRSVQQARIQGVEFLNEKFGLAVWSVGNCLVTAEEIVSGQTEVKLFNYKKTAPDLAACNGWTRLIKRWNDVGLVKTEQFGEKQARCEVPEQPPDYITKALNYLEDDKKYEREWRFSAVVDGAIPGTETMSQEWERELQSLSQYFEIAREVQSQRQEVADKMASDAAEELWEELENLGVQSSEGQHGSKGGISINGKVVNVHGDIIGGDSTGIRD